MLCDKKTLSAWKLTSTSPNPFLFDWTRKESNVLIFNFMSVKSYKNTKLIFSNVKNVCSFFVFIIFTSAMVGMASGIFSYRSFLFSCGCKEFWLHLMLIVYITYGHHVVFCVYPMFSNVKFLFMSAPFETRLFTWCLYGYRLD